MVNHLSTQLNDIFSALADPTRRSMIEKLSKSSMKLSELDIDYKMSAPAISKHLRVMEKAKLIKREKIGRQVIVHLQKQTLKSGQEWFKYYEKFWTQQFDRLEKHLSS